MSERPPPMPTGDDEEAIFMQYVLRQSQREFIDTPTVKFHVDRNSIRAHAAPKRGASASAGPSMFQLMSVEFDWLACRTLAIDSAGVRTVGDEDIIIAKNPKLRNSVVQEVIAGETINYSYTTETERIADNGTITETQFVVPPFLVDDDDNDGDIIYAIKPKDGTGVWYENLAEEMVQIEWLDTNNDARAWAWDEDE